MNPMSDNPLKFEDLFFATSRQFEKIIEQERESGKALKQQIREGKARHAQELSEAIARIKKFSEAFDKQKAELQNLRKEYDSIKIHLQQSTERELNQKRSFQDFKEKAEELSKELRSQVQEEEEENRELARELKETENRLKAQVSFLQGELKDAKDQLNRTEANYHELKHYSDSLKLRYDVEAKELRAQNHDIHARLKRALMELQSLQNKNKQLSEQNNQQTHEIANLTRAKESIARLNEDRERMHASVMGLQQRLKDSEKEAANSQDEIYRLKAQMESMAKSMATASMRAQQTSRPHQIPMESLAMHDSLAQAMNLSTRESVQEELDEPALIGYPVQ
jgi:chromosome segregation ATPase